MLGARATWALWARPRPSEAAPVRGRARPRPRPSVAGAAGEQRLGLGPCAGAARLLHTSIGCRTGEGPEDRTNL